MIRKSFTSMKMLALSAVAVGALFGVSGAAKAALYFYPAKPWEIAAQGFGCSVSNEYNNGFIVSVTADKSGHMGARHTLNVDFRQNALTRGKTYNVSLSLPNQVQRLMQGQASSGSVVSIPLNQDPAFVGLLIGAPTFNLILEGNEFNFSLVGLAAKSEQYKNCSRGGGAHYKPSGATPYGNLPVAGHGYSAGSAGRSSVPYAGASLQGQSPQSIMAQGAHRSQGRATSAPAPVALPMKKPKGAARKGAGATNFASPMAGSGRSMPIMNGKDWTLEKATLRYQEVERQLQKMGQKLQKERAQCKIEKKELEALLFDPQLTSEQQLAKLSNLEEELRRTRLEMRNQELQYKERIRVLQEQFGRF